MIKGKEHYKSGFVSLIGRPNVGKSTLINQFMEQKLLIMSDKPQTTRNKIRCIYTQDDAQIIFLDTPGVHKPHHRLGNYMVDVAVNTLREVDVVLFLVDVTAPLGKGDQYIVEKLKEMKTPVILVLNKIDLLSPEKFAQQKVIYEALHSFERIISISALEKTNINLLLEEIIGFLPEGPQYYPEDMITDRPERFIVGEVIREKVLLLTHDEIPHSVAVEVEEMKERKGHDTVFVRATIYVERESQKGIVIGKKGKLLRAIGVEARKEIEALLGTKIYLELWVKVSKDWRNKESTLRQLGYE